MLPALPARPSPQRHEFARRRDADERLDVSPDGPRAFVLGAVREHRRGQGPHHAGGQIDLVGFRVEHPAVQGGMRRSRPRRLAQSSRGPPIGVRHGLLHGLLLQLGGLALVPLDAQEPQQQRVGFFATRTLHAGQRRQAEVAQAGPDPPAFLPAVQDEARMAAVAGNGHLRLLHDLQLQGLFDQQQDRPQDLPMRFPLEHLPQPPDQFIQRKAFFR